MSFSTGMTWNVRTASDGRIGRRAFLHAAGVSGALGMGWRSLAASPQAVQRRGVSCIVIWMGGGPSQFESFDPKPGTDTGGPTKRIQTAVPGIEIAAGWEKTAAVMDDLAIIRSMTHVEGEHGRATYYTHTGYNPSPAIAYPAVGSVAAAEVGIAGFDLPHFIRVSAANANAIGAGFLGASVSPFLVTDPNKLPANVVSPVGTSDGRLDRRLALLDRLATEQTAGDRPRADEQRVLAGRARRMMQSPRLPAFDLSREPDKLRDEYGRNAVGQGCLLARRLVEAGVTFVEVASTHPDASAGWDTHIDNFDVTAKLVGWTDPASAALIRDLKQRGLLDNTLVVLMGEFGRTPKINDRGKTGGRDHYPKAFSVALAGAGVRGGRVIGATDAKGVAVTERPVRVPDLLATIYERLGVDYTKAHEALGGFPVDFVDGGKPVTELWS